MKNDKIAENFTKCFFIILLGGIFVQIFKVLFEINLTMPLTIAIFIIYFCLSIKYRYINKSYFYIIISIIMILFLYSNMTFFDMKYLRVSLNIALFGIIYYNIDIKYIVEFEKNIRIYIYVFFIFNIILYFSGSPIFFKDLYIENTLRFKGFMPDANALASLGLYLLLISLVCIKKSHKILPSILIIVIIVSTGSRGNTVFAILIFLLMIIKNKTVLKIIPIVFITYLLWPLIVKLSAINRLFKFGLGDNGRNLLSDIAKSIFNNSSYFEKLTGIKMNDLYIQCTSNINGFKYHDFAENSYITMTMLFGIIGLGILFIIILKIFFDINKNKVRFRENIILIFFIILFGKQDIILSTQLFMFMITSLKILAYYDY